MKRAGAGILEVTLVRNFRLPSDSPTALPREQFLSDLSPISTFQNSMQQDGSGRRSPILMNSTSRSPIPTYASPSPTTERVQTLEENVRALQQQIAAARRSNRNTSQLEDRVSVTKPKIFSLSLSRTWHGQKNCLLRSKPRSKYVAFS